MSSPARGAPGEQTHYIQPSLFPLSTPHTPHTPDLRQAQEAERQRCTRELTYFLRAYAQIENPSAGGWVPFDLWPAQVEALAVLEQRQRVAVLKARQLGLTWLCLGYALWRMTFYPPASVLLFSQTERSARELIVRLRGMHARLPEWLRGGPPTVNRATELALANGARALAFSTRGGRSYTATLALVDEADFIPDLASFLNAVKPTVDAPGAGGQFFLVSTADKRRPLSPFKQIFRAARPAPLRAGMVLAEGEGNPGAGEEDAGGYTALFLPWHARPGRTPDWYARVRREMVAQRGSEDDLHQEYPATPEEALALPTFDRRLPPEFLAAAYAPASPLPARFLPPAAPALPGLAVFRLPQRGGSYVIGCDPAEGNPQSDESVAAVFDAFGGEQIAVLGGRLQPESFAAAVDALSVWANGAPALVERNNHGHTVIAWLREHSALQLLPGLDRKPGWLTNAVTKTRLYDEVARACRTGECAIHDAQTHAQLGSLEASTLAAPSGGHDDRATACALALAALRWAAVGARSSDPVAAPDPLVAYDRGPFV